MENGSFPHEEIRYHSAAVGRNQITFLDRIYKIDRMDTRNHDHVHPVKLAR